MGNKDDTRPAARSGVGTMLDEEAKLDQMLEDSFPTSDPPSFTPVTGSASAPVDTYSDQESEAGGHGRAKAMTAATTAVLALVAFAWWRHHRSS
jgi:hypothetical protein